MPLRAVCDRSWSRPWIVRHQTVMGLYVAGLWRYFVKTLAGERRLTATVGLDGIAGDRVIWVVGHEGVRTSRRHYCLLRLRGTWSQQGHALINGHIGESPEAVALVKRAAGDDASLEASDARDRLDVLPLLVATDGAVAAFGHDVRRLRPNILISGVDGLGEREWP